MQEVKKIEFTLENCETIEVDRKHIRECQIHNLNNIRIKENLCNSFHVKILAKANVINVPFQMSNLIIGQTIFERLRVGDITGFKLFYNNGNTESYILPYEEKDTDVIGSPNIYQTTWSDDDYNLHISIVKNIRTKHGIK